ncbi:hypothetical protein [Micromonospora sp. NPDC005220]|uniref:hypothetical protein n=1 Tax=Micromonospora sp. NPDC005220 TaxID=3155589 RepID=UPI0033BE735F
MKPKPFSELNHLTVPVAMHLSLFKAADPRPLADDRPYLFDSNGQNPDPLAEVP